MTQMPAWSVAYGGPLTDQDVRHVVAFIRSWEPTAPVIEPAVFDAQCGAWCSCFSIPPVQPVMELMGWWGLHGMNAQDQKVCRAG